MPQSAPRRAKKGLSLFGWLMLVLSLVALLGAALLLLGVTRYNAPVASPPWDVLQAPSRL